MAEVVLYTDQDAITRELSNIRSGVSKFQAVYNALVSLGAVAEQITIEDLANVLNGGSISLIREIVLRGKALQIDGIPIDPSIISLNPAGIQSLLALHRSLPPHAYKWHVGYFQLADGVVSAVDTLEDLITPRYQVRGTQAQADALAALANAAATISALRTSIGADDRYHPLYNPETWFMSNTSGQYVVNIPRVAKYLATV